MTEIESTFSTKLSSISTNVTNTFTTIASTISDKLKSASEDVTAKMKEIAETIDTKMSAASSSISTEAGKWAGTVKDAIKAVKDNFPEGFSWDVPNLPSLSCDWADVVEKAIKAVKDQFGGGFSWGVPELKIPVKIPKFKVEGKFEYNDDGEVTKVPTVSVEWYRRAAEMGALFDSPTIIGVGDAAQPELLIGEDTLFNKIRDAVAMGNGFNQTNNITVQDGATASETARMIRNQTKQLLNRMRGGV